MYRTDEECVHIKDIALDRISMTVSMSVHWLYGDKEVPVTVKVTIAENDRVYQETTRRFLRPGKFSERIENIRILLTRLPPFAETLSVEVSSVQTEDFVIFER
jgi:hypothetical protein